MQLDEKFEEVYNSLDRPQSLDNADLEARRSQNSPHEREAYPGQGKSGNPHHLTSRSSLRTVRGDGNGKKSETIH
jgi:hypothetical protein